MKRHLRRFAEFVFSSPTVRKRAALIFALATVLFVWRWEQSHDVQLDSAGQEATPAVDRRVDSAAGQAQQPNVDGTKPADQSSANMTVAPKPPTGPAESPVTGPNSTVAKAAAKSPAAPAAPGTATSAYPEDIGVDSVE